MKRVVHADEWVTLSVDAESGIARYERTDKGYANLAELERSHDRIALVLPGIPPGLKLLLDLRRAPPRNDDAFESIINGVIGPFLVRFARHAVLVRTMVGRLQVKRLAAERGHEEANIFDDEAAALAYLAAAR